jgi:hypothetical protein
MSESDVNVGTISDAVQAQQHVGWNFGFEGRFNDWFGIEIDYVRATQDVDFGSQTIGTTDFSPLSATFNIHVVHTTVVDSTSALRTPMSTGETSSSTRMARACSRPTAFRPTARTRGGPVGRRQSSRRSVGSRDSVLTSPNRRGTVRTSPIQRMSPVPRLAIDLDSA